MFLNELLQFIMNIISGAIAVVGIAVSLILYRLVKTPGIRLILVAVIYGALIRILMLTPMMTTDVAGAFMCVFWILLVTSLFLIYRTVKHIANPRKR